MEKEIFSLILFILFLVILFLVLPHLNFLHRQKADDRQSVVGYPFKAMRELKWREHQKVIVKRSDRKIIITD